MAVWFIRWEADILEEVESEEFFIMVLDSGDGLFFEVFADAEPDGGVHCII